MKHFLKFCVFFFGYLVFYILSNPVKDSLNAMNPLASVKAPPSVSPIPHEQIKNIPTVKPSFQALPAITPKQKNVTLPIENANENSDGQAGLQANEDLSIINRHKLKIDAINDLMRDKPDEKLSDISASNFNKEEVDYEWGLAYEQKIGAFFHETPAFSGFSPDIIECHSENCKITISAANKDQLTNISASVVDAVYSSNNELTKNAIYVIDEETNTLSFYFGRNEEGDSISTILQ